MGARAQLQLATRAARARLSARHPATGRKASAARAVRTERGRRRVQTAGECGQAVGGTRTPSGRHDRPTFQSLTTALEHASEQMISGFEVSPLKISEFF